ncbi:MAG: Hpt domain-containing protein [Deltaproteobacteria bacterium]|nr:Hpt domain-containing protein [Deltaproteobacteria bacterium]
MDFKGLADRLGLEKEEFIELAELFVETGSSDLRQLQSAVEQGDVQEVVKKSHSIKGASGNLGFTEIFGVAKDVEANAREDNLDGAVGAVVVIKEKIDQLAQAINEKA